MTNKRVDVYPEKITIAGTTDDKRTVIHVHLHTDLSLKANDTLSLNLELNQIEVLHNELIRHLDAFKKS
ncbi:hypothetical protein E1D14_05025 [Salmonella enterica subsp. enterica serovar Manhattan]|nr:hypothetical protein [Salmonella enterica subsp. enterica serovar Manhattan]